MDWENRPKELLDGEKMSHAIYNNINDIIRAFRSNEEKLQQYHNELLDLEHIIEFQDANIVSGYKLYKQLQTLRRKRRILKNEQQSIEPLYNFLIKYKSFYELIPNIQSSCAKQNNNIKSKVYSPRSDRFNVDYDKLGEEYTLKLAELVDEL